VRVAKARVGWRKRAPMRRWSRRELKAKCGTKCFMDPRGDGGAGAFPVCQKLSHSRGKCVVDCEGLLSAFNRARQTKRPKIARRAVRMACRSGCSWTKAKQRCPT